MLASGNRENLSYVEERLSSFPPEAQEQLRAILAELKAQLADREAFAALANESDPKRLAERLEPRCASGERLLALKRLEQLEREDGTGKVTSYEYDDLQRVSAIDYPASHRCEYAFDDLGRLATSKSPEGITIAYEYDDAGRLIGRAVTERSGIVHETAPQSFVYDGLDRWVTASTEVLPGTPTVTAEHRAFDGQGRVVAEGFIYDPADGSPVVSRLVTATHVDADQRVTVTLRTTGLEIETSSKAGAGVSTWKATRPGPSTALYGAMTAGPNGMMQRTTAGSKIESTYTYTDWGRPKSLSHTLGSHGEMTFVLTFNGDGMLTSASQQFRDPRELRYEYDGQKRLRSSVESMSTTGPNPEGGPPGAVQFESTTTLSRFDLDGTARDTRTLDHSRFSEQTSAGTHWRTSTATFERSSVVNGKHEITAIDDVTTSAAHDAPMTEGYDELFDQSGREHHAFRYDERGNLRAETTTRTVTPPGSTTPNAPVTVRDGTLVYDGFGRLVSYVCERTSKERVGDSFASSAFTYHQVVERDTTASYVYGASGRRYVKQVNHRRVPAPGPRRHASPLQLRGDLDVGQAALA